MASVSGNSTNDSLKGTTAGDSVYGNAGNDTLNGLAGDDFLDGGEGRDWVSYADASGAVSVNLLTGLVTGASGEDSLVGIESVIGSRFNDNLVGDSEANELSGGAGNDVLEGGAGDDTLIGGSGIDLLTGGEGDDVYEVDVAGDVIVEREGEGTDLVNVRLTSGSYALSEHVENATVVSTSSVGIQGNALNNLLTGNAAANTLSGGAGDDTLDGGLGSDRLIGGLGDDLYRVNTAGDVIVEALGEGKDRVEVAFTASGTYTLSANVEDATVVSAATIAVNLTGNDGNNLLIGHAGRNVLNGGKGDDELVSGGGSDTVDGGEGVDTLVLEGNRADYMLTRNATYTMLSRNGATVSVRNMEQIRFDDGSVSMAQLLGNATSAYGDTLEGTSGDERFDGLAGDDVISGLDGNDTLIGGTGKDTLIGGLGDDVYEVDSTLDKIVETADEGHDLVEVRLASGSYTLPDNVEDGRVISTTGVGIIGNALDNWLVGNAAANTLTGGAGNDTLDGGLGSDRLVGGLGDDVYYINTTSDVVVEASGEGNDLVHVSLANGGTYTLAANVEQAVVDSGSGAKTNLTGNLLDNVLTGHAGSNVLSGGAGNDMLVGNGGNDTLDGGAGTADCVVMAGSRDDYTITRPGADVVFTHRETGEVTVVRNVELYQFAGRMAQTAADVLVNIASDGNDVLTGTSSYDVIDGQAGDDYIMGMADSDMLLGGAGNDTLLGGWGYDYLDGGTGADRMIGGADDDFYMVDSVGDVIIELPDEGSDAVQVQLTSGTYVLGDNVETVFITSSGAVSLTGNACDNTMYGNAAANKLMGEGGNDLLIGGLGKDTLTGGLGSDTFSFYDEATSTNVDTITDFNAAEGDKILLAAGVFSKLGRWGGTAPLGGQYLTYNEQTGALVYDADGAGGAAGMTIAILGTTTHPALTAADIILG